MASLVFEDVALVAELSTNPAFIAYGTEFNFCLGNVVRLEASVISIHVSVVVSKIIGMSVSDIKISNLNVPSMTGLLEMAS